MRKRTKTEVVKQLKVHVVDHRVRGHRDCLWCRWECDVGERQFVTMMAVDPDLEAT